MPAVRSIAVAFVCAVLANGAASAAAPAAPAATPAPAADPVKDQLDKAKAQRTDERAKARAALVQAVDAQIKAAGSAGDLDALKLLTAQKDGFVTAGVLPNLPALKDAVALYTQALRKADGGMVAAYETAIEAYTSKSKAEEAMNVRKERHALLEGTNEPASPDAPGLVLDRAKSDYQKAVDDAKKAYVQAFDAKITAATDAGNLTAVTKLQAAKTAAEADAALPEGFNDPALLTAKSRYGLAVQAANVKLAQAYRDAVRNFTRARSIEKAQAVQAEFDATGLGAMPAAGAAASPAGASGDSTTKLVKTLPAYLAATGAFAIEKDGIRPGKGVIVGTKAADFLGKDFVFDVAVRMPKDEEWVIVGLGDGTEKGSMRVVIRNDSGWGRRAFLTHGDQWGQHIGDIHSGEPYVIRVERHGGPVTVSVGVTTEGKFTADITQTVSDPKEFVPTLTEKRAQLFFTGGAPSARSDWPPGRRLLPRRQRRAAGGVGNPTRPRRRSSSRPPAPAGRRPRRPRRPRPKRSPPRASTRSIPTGCPPPSRPPAPLAPHPPASSPSTTRASSSPRRPTSCRKTSPSRRWSTSPARRTGSSWASATAPRKGRSG